ncbi:LysR substrate-binding domain-containing protein [Paenibacillus sp. MBLB4367]|uniref:LysR family transcriptional regulator n=1 Tax=Paenibacillus sp. MBLB4367 TaxID=3384767 RepID=UPI00390831D5
MEISDFRIFRSVADHGSVSKAAKELNYVQSNVTARIQQLEQELGTVLFNRHRRGVALTADGKRLIVYAEQVLASIEEIKRAFQDSDDPSGPLVIGLVDTVSSLSRLLSEFYGRYPRIDLSLMTGVTEQLLKEVLQYRLDGAFVSGPIRHPDIAQEQLMEEELVLIAKAEGGPATLEECKTRPLLVFRDGCGYRARLMQWLEAEGIKPAKVMEFGVGTLETLLAVVKAGLGISLVTRSIAEQLERQGSIRCFSIPGELGRVSTVLIWRNDAYMTGGLRKLLDTVRSIRGASGS